MERTNYNGELRIEDVNKEVGAEPLNQDENVKSDHCEAEAAAALG